MLALVSAWCAAFGDCVNMKNMNYSVDHAARLSPYMQTVMLYSTSICQCNVKQLIRQDNVGIGNKRYRDLKKYTFFQSPCVVWHQDDQNVQFLCNKSRLCNTGSQCLFLISLVLLDRLYYVCFFSLQYWCEGFFFPAKIHMYL